MAEKKEIEAFNSKEVQKESTVKEMFDMKNFPHWFDTDEEDYDDFDEKDRDENQNIS